MVSSWGKEQDVMSHAYLVNPDHSVTNANKEFILKNIPKNIAPEQCDRVRQELETTNFPSLEHLILFYETNFPNSKKVSDSINPAVIMAQKGFGGFTGLESTQENKTSSKNQPNLEEGQSPRPKFT